MKKILIVLILSAAVFFSCSDESKVITLESGLKILDDSLGTGKEVKPNDLVTIHFEGWTVMDTSNLFGNWSATFLLDCSAISLSFLFATKIALK